jgi:hypothetical protein
MEPIDTIHVSTGVYLWQPFFFIIINNVLEEDQEMLMTRIEEKFL